MDLSDARVVVMGGSSGIGWATASLLVEQGADVTITGRSPEKLAAAASALSGPVSAKQVDATNREQLDSFFQGIGRISHLVTCVTGREGGGPFASLDLTSVRRAFAEKTFAQLESLQSALPSLDTDGSVTFITAASAQAALPGTIGLAAVNGALEAAVRPLAVELAPVRVNAVSPGVVDTSWWDSWGEADRASYFAQTAQSLPVRRTGKAEDIAAAVVLLVSNGFITGHVLVADGGAHLAH